MTDGTGIVANSVQLLRLSILPNGLHAHAASLQVEKLIVRLSKVGNNEKLDKHLFSVCSVRIFHYFSIAN